MTRALLADTDPDDDTRIQLWDVTHGEPVLLPYEFSTHTDRVQFVAHNTRLFVEHGTHQR